MGDNLPTIKDLVIASVAQELADTTAALAPIVAVQNDADARRAKNAVKAVKAVVKVISTARMDATRQADAWKKHVIEQERDFTAAANAEIARVDALVGAYVAAKAQAEEEARRAEEAKRAAELAEAQRIAEAEAALTGKEIAVPVPIAEEPQKRSSIVQGVTARTVWTFDVTDPDAVPRAYCAPDEKAIRAYMDAAKKSGASIESLSIQGVAFRKEIRV
jgi:hypothetical protein